MKRRNILLLLVLVITLSAILIAKASSNTNYRGKKELDTLEQYVNYPKNVSKQEALASIKELRSMLSQSEISHYVLNKNSMKFHLPTCDSVENMSPNNRIDYTGERDLLEQVGYVPCKRCRP